MKKVPAVVRRSVLAGFLLLLVGGNVWVVRRQFPPAERRKNEAYDAGLRALTVDRDFRAAELHFQVYLELAPRKAHVHYLLGLALQQQGKRDAAKAAFEHALELDADMDDARLALAELAKDDLDYLEALRQLDAAVAEEPTASSIWQYRGDLMVEIGDRQAAIGDYERAIAQDKLAYRAYLALGDLLLSRHVLSGSIQDRTAAASRFLEARKACRDLMNANNEREMRIAIAKAISGEARATQSISIELAIEELDKVRLLDPDDPEPVLLIADFQRRMGDTVAAARTLQTALGRWRSPAVFLALHELRLETGEFGAARQALLDAIQESNEDASLRIRLIGFLVERGEFDEAATEAERAGNLLGEDFRIHEALGDLAAERARRLAADDGPDAGGLDALRSEALSRYQRALALRPRSLRLKKKLAGRLIDGFLARGEGAQPTDEERKAREYLRDVLAVNRLDTEALAWTARFRLLDGEYEGVVEDLTPALTAHDPSLDALRILGAAAHRIGRDDLASQAFELVVHRLTDRDGGDRRDDTKASAADWRNLAGAYLAAGDNLNARTAASEGWKAWPADRGLPRVAGVADLRAGDAASARRVLRAACEVFRDDVTLRLLLARALEETGDVEGAERELTAALEAHPSKETRGRYFAFLARTGRASQAEEGFLALVAAQPDDPETLLALGDFYAKQGAEKRALALEQYEKALALATSPVGPLLRIVELHLVTAHRDGEALVAAEDAAGRLREAVPEDPILHYVEGKLALARQDAAAALASLDRYLAVRERDASAHFYRCRALRRLERHDDAAAALHEAIRLAPEREEFRVELATVQIDQGLAASRRGDADAAKRYFAAARNHGGKADSRAELLLAGAQANLGEFDVSEKAVRELLVREPENVSGLHLLAGILLQKQDRSVLDEAESLYRRVLRVDAEDLIAQVGVGTVQFQKGLFEDALQTLRSAYVRTGGNVGVALAVAQCMAYGGDGPGALAFIEAEITTYPESHLMQHMKGDFLMHFKQPDLAVKAYLRAFEMNRKNDVALLAAVAALAETREYARASKLLQDNLDKAENSSRLRVALADMLLRLGRIDEAEEQLRTSIAEQPDHPRALLLLGRIADARGQRSDAKRYYVESIESKPFDTEARLLLAQILIAEGDERGAIEHYRNLLRVSPRDTTALNNLAELLGRNENELEEAITLAKKASVLTEDPLVLDTLGWLQFRNGEFAAASRVLEQAAVVLERNVLVQYHAGMALARAGERGQARRFLTRALALDENFEHAATARAEIEKLK